MFSKKNRLSKRKDILLVLKKGEKITTSVCNLYLLRGDPKEEARISIVVSKKVSGSAVVRNKVKRIFREILRSKVDELQRGLRLVIVARREVLGAEKAFIERTLGGVLKYA